MKNTAVSTDELLRRVRSVDPDANDEIVRDFAARMDAEYFSHFSPADIAAHVRLAARLNPDHLCEVSIDRRPDGLCDVLIVAYDYFSEFAIIAGLLSAFKLDIREGRIYTFEDAATPPSTRRDTGMRGTQRQRPVSTRKKIVDLFRVTPIPGHQFTQEEQDRFAEELEAMIHLLDLQRIQEARHRVNRRLVETRDQLRGRFTGLLHPVRIEFNNALSPTDTVMDIRSVDTPAFLYTFANALAMRGIYIRKARFEQVGAELHDRFFVTGRYGQKIVDPGDQQDLRLTATLIKQFTHFLTWAPDPAKALDHFDRFLDQLLEGGREGQGLAFLKEKKTLATLARLLGTSDFLWEDFLRRQHDNLLPMLDSYRRAPLIRPKAEMVRELRKRTTSSRNEEQRRRALNQYKDQEMFRIDMKHLLDGGSTLPEFSAALTELAEVVLDQSVRDCQTKLSHAHGWPLLPDGRPCPFAIFGMGKFGGRELGYASDIEVLFVYGGPGKTDGRESLENSEYFERLVQELLRWIEAKQEGIFHLDVRLRPHGGKGLLANRVDELRTYYSPQGLAAPFERQALIKLRHVSGDGKLGRLVEDHRNRYVYSDEPFDLRAALDLRSRQVAELVEPDKTNIKFSPGGLIDLEYAVQYLQLLHGHRHPELRTPNTLEAVDALTRVRLLTAHEGSALRESYLFFRMLIDGLRIVRGHAKDLVLPPDESEAFVFLARRIGYTTEAWEEGAAKLKEDIHRHMDRTRRFFETRFGKVSAR